MAQTRAGKGDTDGLDLVARVPARRGRHGVSNVHILWTDLIAASDADTARRLPRDPAFKTRAPALTDPAGRGRHARLLGQHRSTAGREGALDSVARRVRHGRRRAAAASTHTCKRSRRARASASSIALRTEPEATYAQYTARWEDMGNPAYSNPQTARPRPHRRPHVGQRDPQVRDRPGRRRVERRRQPRQAPVLVRVRRARARASRARGRASG